jgi:hypothetical protein
MSNTAQNTDESFFCRLLMVLCQVKSVSSVGSTVPHSVREPMNLNTALVKPLAKTLTAGAVRWVHYVHFLTMMRSQLRSCKTGQMVVWMHAGSSEMDDSVSAQPYLLPLPSIFPRPQPCPLRFQPLLAADIWSQKCCGVEVADRETRLDTTDTAVRKREPGIGVGGGGLVYRGF